ncbi:MAG TPA: hypothetical protein VG867_05330 [Rhizomicrobium sp.]|nr:hypothetical protein [Rhizomicrobium sp.]
MTRISGPMAIIAGLFLTLPGFFALIHAQTVTIPIASWLARDLLIAAIGGLALMVWGGTIVRRRELQLNDLEEARRWLRVQR